MTMKKAGSHNRKVVPLEVFETLPSFFSETEPREAKIRFDNYLNQTENSLMAIQD